MLKTAANCHWSDNKHCYRFMKIIIYYRVFQFQVRTLRQKKLALIYCLATI